MKNTNEKTSPAPKRLFWAGRVGIFFLSFVLMVLILVFERDPTLSGQEFAVGEPAPRTVFAPFTLSYVNQEETDRLRQEESQSIAPVYRVGKKTAKDFREKMDGFFSAVQKAKQAGDAFDISGFKDMPIEVSDSSLKILLEADSLEEASQSVEIFLEQTVDFGVFDTQTKQELLDARISKIQIVNPETGWEQEALVGRIPTIQDLQDSVPRSLRTTLPKKRRLRQAVTELLEQLDRSNLDYDEAETRRRQHQAESAVPEIEEEIKKGELLAQRGMRLTSYQKMRLDMVQKKLTKQKVIHKLLAVGVLVFLTYLLSFAYLWLFERKTLLSLNMVLLIHALMLLTVLLCKAISLWPDASPYWMPFALAPLLLTLLSNLRLGFWSSIVMAVFAAPITDFRPEVVMAVLLASLAGVLTSYKIRKRIQFLKVGAAIGMTYALVLFVFQMFYEHPAGEAMIVGAQGLANGLLITMPLAFLLTPLLESIFDLTTDITLLELSDLNHPLLKRMMVEAPGTYHHSLGVSALSERACEAIGANPLLARVGCYFHDIGKIVRSEYFTENQKRRTANKHDRLSPEESRGLILSHVKDGIALGRRYKLKKEILRFIPEHQGTGVIYYFYRKALDQAKPGEVVRVEDYRYPGPKPQNRETAVAMLADTTEAASRSLEEPNDEAISRLVRKIINDKFIDGQLDECDLTLRDLHKIQENFIHHLMAIFHTRIPYPEKPEVTDGSEFLRPETSKDCLKV